MENSTREAWLRRRYTAMILNGLGSHQQSWRSMGVRCACAPQLQWANPIEADFPMRHPASRAAEPKIPLMFKFYSRSLCRIR